MSKQASENQSLSPRFIRYEGSVNIFDTMSQEEIPIQVWDEMYGSRYQFITIQSNDVEEIEQVEVNDIQERQRTETRIASDENVTMRSLIIDLTKRLERMETLTLQKQAEEARKNKNKSKKEKKKRKKKNKKSKKRKRNGSSTNDGHARLKVGKHDSRPVTVSMSKEAHTGFQGFFKESDKDITVPLNDKAAAAIASLNVSNRTMRDILVGKFVHLQELLPKGSSNDKEESAVARIEGDVLRMEKKKRAQIRSRTDWLSAFRHFMMICNAIFPRRSFELTSYMEHVEHCFNMYESNAVLEYDVQRRRLAECGQLSLAESRPDLVTRFLSPYRLREQNLCSHCKQRAHLEGEWCPEVQDFVGRHKKRVATGFCAYFNKGEPCVYGTSCKFMHACQICGQGSHGMSDHDAVAKSKRSSHKPSSSYACSYLNVDIILQDCEHYDEVDLLREILIKGANIRYRGNRNKQCLRPEYKVRPEFREVVRKKIKEDVEKGYRKKLSPKQIESMDCFMVQPLHIAFKKSYGKITSKPRLVDDCSAGGLNEWIEIPEVPLRCWDNLMKFIAKHPGPMFIGKSDIKAAYKQVSVCKEDQCLLGTFFEDNFYKSIRLPFGLKSSSYLWGIVAEAIAFRVRLEAKSELRKDFFVDVYVDDFIFVVLCPNDAVRLMEIFFSVTNRWKINVSREKTFTPSKNALEVLGVVVKVSDRTLEIPEERLRNLREELRRFQKQTPTRRELQSLLGHLLWISRVISAGKVFTFRLRELLNTLKSSQDVFTQTEWMKDVDWWTRVPLRQSYPIKQVLRYDWIGLYSDASLWGFGFVLNLRWFSYGSWESISGITKHMLPESPNINELEMFTILLMVASLKEQLQNKTIIMECDNKVTVEALNNRSCGTRTLRACCRVLHLMAADLNCAFKLVHVSGVKNVIADELSRNKIPNKLQIGRKVPLAKEYLLRWWTHSESSWDPASRRTLG